MDVKPTLCSLFLLLLILLGSCNGKGWTKTDDGTLIDHKAHTDMRIEQVHSHSSLHMDPSLIVFFFVEDLRKGNTIPIYFPKRKLNSSTNHLLPKEEADSIPFSSQHLHHLLHLFSFSRGSPQAIAMEDTLRQCETKPIMGETKTCATSWESMLDFTRRIVGSENIQVLYTTYIKETNDAFLQKYTIVDIHEISVAKTVACHTMPYPYAVFYCHYQESQSRVFRVSLAGENGEEIEAIGVCHMDTSQWSRNHVAFEVLGVEPGSIPICHFFPADNFVCVPSTTPMKA